MVEIKKTLAKLSEVLASYFGSSLSKELEMSKTTNLPALNVAHDNRVDFKGKFHVLFENCQQEVAN